MKLTVDRERYDRLQKNVLRRIEGAVRGQLRLVLSGRVPADLNEVTCDVVAAVASIIDGSAEVEEGGMPVIPVLGFAATAARDELVFAELGCGSWMHGYTY